MFYFNINNQISFLISACFSFLIFISSVSLNKGRNQLKLLGFCFFIPFLSGIASFLSTRYYLHQVLLFLGDAALMYFLFFALKVNPKGQYQSFLGFVTIMFPFAIYWSLYKFREPINFLISAPVAASLYSAGVLLNIYALRKEKGRKLLLFWSLLFLGGSGVLQSLRQDTLIVYTSLFLKFSAYLVFYLYFYKEITSKIMSKVQEAEKRVKDVNENLNLEVKKRVFEIERSNEKLVHISRTDTLTKAYNKAAILDIINRLIDSKPEKVFSILMFDIDRFKEINDTLGHVEGDKCIKKVALTAGKSIRDIDSFGRYGGDEFIIVLPGIPTAQARIIADRFRSKVSETESPKITVSIGIASYPEDGRTVKDLIAYADEGLYLSKKNGRNTVSHKGSF